MIILFIINRVLIAIFCSYFYYIICFFKSMKYVLVWSPIDDDLAISNYLKKIIKASFILFLNFGSWF